MTSEERKVKGKLYKVTIRPVERTFNNIKQLVTALWESITKCIFRNSKQF